MNQSLGNHFSRLGTLTLIAGGALLVPVPLANAAGSDLRPASNTAQWMISNLSPGSAQGYLGVGTRDLDNDRAAALKLKDAHGAEIVSIDQDAPAFKAGLKVRDVVVQMNGQRIEGVEQFRRMLRETPPGRTVSLVAMRDGQPQTVSVELADRALLATKVIGNLDSDPPLDAIDDGPSPSMVLPGDRGHGGSHANGFFGSLTRNRYYVGVDIQPLPTGLADYFGVKNGVLVGNVFSNSPGAAAGFKPADVIQKVAGKPIATLSDWERAIRVNHGKKVQVTIIRDHKEQTLSMVVGEPKNSGELELPDADMPDAAAVAELREGLEGIDAAAIASQMAQETSRLAEQMKGVDLEGLREQAEEAAKSAAGVDVEKIQKQALEAQKQALRAAQDAMQNIDTRQLQKQIEESQRMFKENGQQFEQQMQQLRESLKSLQFEQMD